MDRLVEEINTKVKDGKIPCKEALAIAERLDLTPAQVGKKLNELKIKIQGCQLGCF
jgi:hypothetical protein